MEQTHFYKNIEIIYEDASILVCAKPAGVPVQSRQLRTPDLETMLKNHLALSQKGSVPYLGIVHRLDQPVEGLLVFAKTPAAAAALTRQLTSEGFGKHYLALTGGRPSPDTGTLTCHMVKDGRTNTSRVCPAGTPNAKYAELSYEVVAQNNPASPCLVHIKLKTGRHHQIRVQFADAGAPLIGDAKYNPAAKETPGVSLALCAYRLNFLHPQSKKPMEFIYTPKNPAFQGFSL